MSQELNRLIINCGSSHVSASVVSNHGEQLKIEKSLSVPLEYDFQDEDAWLDAVSDGIREIVREGKLSGNANFIIPGSQVLAKTIRVPSVDKAKRAQVLAFEAQQNLPYDLDEVVWDSQILSDDGIETEVLLGACKQEMINDFCEVIQRSGLIVDSINSSSVLSYSVLEYTEPNLEDDVLLINLGARSSTLLFKNDEGFFFRTINIGGNMLTQFISDTLGKDFAEADDIKHRFFAEEDALDEDSSAVRLMQTSVSNFTRRFAQEVNRSIVMYRRQKGGDAVKRIFITGKGANSPLVRAKLAESLDHEIELFDALSGVELAPALDADRDTLNFELSEVVGEAIKEYKLVENGGNLNLLPLAIRQELKFIRQKPILALAAVLIAVFPWMLYLGLSKAKDLTVESSASLKKMAIPFESNKAILAENTARAEVLSQSISQVEGLVDTKTNWIQFFADLQASIFNAKDVWVDDLTVIRPEAYQDEYADEYDDYGYSDGEDIGEGSQDTSLDYEVVVKGKMLVREPSNAINQDVLANRIKQLQASFENSNFVTASKPPKISWKYLSDGLKVLPFEINLIIDTEKPL